MSNPPSQSPTLGNFVSAGNDDSLYSVDTLISFMTRRINAIRMEKAVVLTRSEMLEWELLCRMRIMADEIRYIRERIEHGPHLRPDEEDYTPYGDVLEASKAVNDIVDEKLNDVISRRIDISSYFTKYNIHTLFPALNSGNNTNGVTDLNVQPDSEDYDGDYEDAGEEEDRMSVVPSRRPLSTLFVEPTLPQSAISYDGDESSIHDHLRARNAERARRSRSSSPIGPLRVDDVPVHIPIYHQNGIRDSDYEFAFTSDSNEENQPPVQLFAPIDYESDYTNGSDKENEPPVPLTVDVERGRDETENNVDELQAPTPINAVFAPTFGAGFVRRVLPVTTGIESILAPSSSSGPSSLDDSGLVGAVDESECMDGDEMTATAAVAPNPDLVLADSIGMEVDTTFDIECEKMEREAWEARRRAQDVVCWVPRSTPVSRI